MDIEIIVDAEATKVAVEKALATLDTGALGAFLETTADAWIKFRIRKRFRNEGDSTVGNWLPLTASTQSFRRHGGYPAEHPINYRSGRLFAFLMEMNPSISLMAYGGVQALWPPELPSDVITRRKYITAQKGYRSTPARPVLGIDLIDLAEIETLMAVYITTQTGLTWV